MTDPHELQARREAHELRVPSAKFFSVQQLVARWGLSATSVLRIPFSELPYNSFGQGAKRKRRRYAPDAVAAYEKMTGREPLAHAS